MLETLLALLKSFLHIGLFSIGGGYATIPLIQEQVVSLHSWLTMQEFTDIITISQMTPGPLAVNTSTFVGIQIAGISGAIIATLGCILSGFLISIGLYIFFQKYHSSSYVFQVLSGLKAASIGCIAASASTILLLALFHTSELSLTLPSMDIIACILFLICLFALRKYQVNPMLLMVLSGAAGLLLYR